MSWRLEELSKNWNFSAKDTSPAVLKELKAETEKYNAKHEPHEAIFIDGQTPCEHVEWIMEEYKAQKELDRTRKVGI